MREGDEGGGRKKLGSKRDFSGERVGDGGNLLHPKGSKTWGVNALFRGTN